MTIDVHAEKWQAGEAVSMFSDRLFEDKVAVITGGGSGLGREVAHAFARLGGHPVVAGRTASKLDQVVESITASGGHATAIPTNIREPEEVDVLRDKVYDQLGHVDYLINNAGGQFPGLPSQISDKGWRAVVDLNLNGTWNVTNRFMQPMAEAGTGAIVNIVTLFSLERGAPLFVHSGAARAGVVNMVKTLAPYLMRHGVTINVLAPGVFETPALAESELAPLGHSVESFTEEVQVQRMTVRLGSVDEMAAIVLFLCSPAARYICGSTIVADGASLQGNWASSLLPPEGEL